jgi:nucleotide-binding universal stress UspA family protein
MEIRRIVVPTDLATDTRSAVDMALSIAERRGARVTLLHVAPPGTKARGGEFERRSDEKKVLEQMHALAGEGRDDVELTLQIAEGDPAEEVVAASRTLEADLIVLAIHGREGVSRWFVGGTAESVVRNTFCPVMVVRRSGADIRPTQRYIERIPRIF